MAAEKEDGARRRTSARDDVPERRPAPRHRPAARPRRVSAASAMRNAAEQLAELLGRTPDSVSALKPTDEGWQADVEVVELERIPDTTSVMASYRVTLDEEGELLAYQRIRRYTRGQVDRPM
ncbi:gas vesicle protein [Streptacidiphilus melanogenes]|uniref:gas vesicle protein GvpO n=1 Tax=Streptacidiphilus melanogenes TaxID=411235 RepID=UPI0005A68536|nr:gas vesicle protein [Streptacidiphilus melanogenes]